MSRILFLSGFSAVVLLAGGACTQQPVEHTVRKVTTEDVRRDAEKAVDTAKTAAGEAKEDFEARLKTRLADMEVAIAKLREKGRSLTDEAKVRWNEKMADLEEKQKAASEKLTELGKSTGDAWSRMEKGVQSAWDDLQKAFQEAANEF